jgi:H+/Cl- antiporter ClcA
MVNKRSLSNKKEDNKKNLKAPEGVIIISVLVFATSLLCFFVALSMFNLANPSNYELMKIQFESQEMKLTNPTTFINLGLFFIVLGIVSYLVARGLLKLNKKAWITFMVFIIFFLIISVFALFQLKQYYTSIYLITLELTAIVYMTRKSVMKLFIN